MDNIYLKYINPRDHHELQYLYKLHWGVESDMFPTTGLVAYDDNNTLLGGICWFRDVDNVIFHLAHYTIAPECTLAQKKVLLDLLFEEAERYAEGFKFIYFAPEMKSFFKSLKRRGFNISEDKFHFALKRIN